MLLAARCADTSSMPTSNTPLTVFLADDSRPIRERVASLLADKDMLVVGQASTPAGSIDGILSARPHVVVLDVQLEGGTGLEVLRAVRSAAPEIAVLVF